MTTNISPDLFMAILSMDAYNRGYNPGIADIGGGTIGDATIKSLQASGVSQTQYQAWQDAGFYAVAYDWNGQTVISYRGTDRLTSNFWNDTIGSDIWNAYLQGTGTSMTDQAHLAADFFQSVTGTQTGDPTTADVILTGHSLGGGLAGFVASMYRHEAYIYDNMAFEGAAQNAYYLASSWMPDYMLQNTIQEAIWGDFYNGLTAWSPLIAENIKAYAVTGEFLAANRLEQSTAVNYIDSHGGVRDPVDLHSQALQIVLRFAAQPETTHTLWASIGNPLLNALFNENVGLAAGFSQASNESGQYDPGSKMLTAIAYSALDSGSAGQDGGYGYVFGNTGIRAMFNDADELGSLVTADKVSAALQDSIEGLTQAIVQFAVLMAYNKINFHDYQDESSLFHPLDGILRLSMQDGTQTNSANDAVLLELNVNQDLWKLGQASDAPDVEILGIKKPSGLSAYPMHFANILAMQRVSAR